jgi:general secretion pathway protein A
MSDRPVEAPVAAARVVAQPKALTHVSPGSANGTPSSPSIETAPVPVDPPDTAPNIETKPTIAVDRLARPKGANAFDLQRDAYAALFELWNARFDPSDVPCNQAPQVGLQCLKLNGTWRDIARLDHPVAIELWDEIAEPYYAAILRQRDNVITVRLGDQTVATTADELANHWYGSYIVLWQMPPDYRGNLKVGDEGAAVAWLRQHLATVLQIDLRTPEPARFDESLQLALMRFQRDNGMVPDGIAGPLTWIAMNATSSDATPRLSAGS